MGVGISIHALREEGDALQRAGTGKTVKFQSTPSARRATHQYTGAQPRVDISIHALREEGDCSLLEQIITRKNISIHALREEGDVYQASDTSALSKFQSTPSARRAT